MPTRKKFSQGKLEEIKKGLLLIKELKHNRDLCIYTTGSFGRLEAGLNSDIDLFFLTENGITKINKTLIDGGIIRLCRKMKLPEFSGDGEYLQVHSMDEILKELGSRNDDYLNYFTARMLLLLESKPLFNEDLYDKILNKTIEHYFKDFSDHSTQFQPIFLVNDIIRFWRTMCLNYEHGRNFKIAGMSEKLLREKKLKHSVKNLKLKFSRKLTCYSLLLSLLYIEKKPTKKEVLRLIKMTPLERLEELKLNTDIAKKIDDLIKLYDWFLGVSQVPALDLQKWLSYEANKKKTIKMSNSFGSLMSEVMLMTRHRERLRYYLV